MTHACTASSKYWTYRRQLRDIEANDTSIIAGRHTKIALHDGLLNLTDAGLVVWRDDKHGGLWC